MATKTKKYALPKEFTVVRRRWARGGEEDTRLYNTDNRRMCCLGFACRAAGIPLNAIRDIASPLSVAGESGITCVGLSHGDSNTMLALDAMSINDDAELNDATREKRLAALFKKRGYRIKFV